MTMGTVLVAFLAALAATVVGARMRSTLRRSNSATISGNRSNCPSAARISYSMCFPSIQPNSRIASLNASMRCAEAGMLEPIIHPIR